MPLEKDALLLQHHEVGMDLTSADVDPCHSELLIHIYNDFFDNEKRSKCIKKRSSYSYKSFHNNDHNQNHYLYQEFWVEHINVYSYTVDAKLSRR